MAGAGRALFHRLPPWLRDVGATLHGHRLRRQRYGPETDRLVHEAYARESWDAARWAAWQREALTPVLLQAARHVPWYRRHWEQRLADDPRALARWPVLEKAALREQPRAFLSEHADPARLIALTTSGTTGTPLRLWRSRATSVRWYALFEARARGWHGLTRASRWANIGGQIVVPVRQQHPPFWVWNGGLRQLYMSSYHLSPEAALAYLDALARHRVTSLLGYPSSLHALATGVLARGLAARARALGLQVAIANAEPLHLHQRASVEEAFGCPVRETYGMAEIVAAASECEHGTLHEWPDVGVVELLEGGRPVPDGEPGEIVATGLLHEAMPLIRYRVGDRAVRAAGAPVCACGRGLPRWDRVEGRSDDVLVTPDGRQVGRLDPVFKGGARLLEAQIVQERIDRLVVRVVPAPGFDDGDARLIARAVRERMGDVDVHVERVIAIPRAANGKFRAVISQLSAAERARTERTGT